MKVFADRSLQISFSALGSWSITETYIPEKTEIYEVWGAAYSQDAANDYTCGGTILKTGTTDYFAIGLSHRQSFYSKIILEKGNNYTINLNASGTAGNAITAHILLRPIETIAAP